jgi:hypothetical protein
VRKLGIGLARALAALVTTATSTAVAQEDAGADGGTDAAAAPRATLICQRVDSPGRVRCDVEARVEPGETIAWGDVVIVRTPPFVGALRGRIGPHDATARDAGVWRWALALVAREKGAGDVEARVRLVVCRGERCAPREAPAVGRVVAGD